MFSITTASKLTQTLSLTFLNFSTTLLLRRFFDTFVGDVLERFTNGELVATPHRVIATPHQRSSIIRFNAVTADTVVAPLPEFVSKQNPAKYSAVTMKTHMETTMQNLEKGIGAWDDDTQTSLTAKYKYVNGKDWREAGQSVDM